MPLLRELTLVGIRSVVRVVRVHFVISRTRCGVVLCARSLVDVLQLWVWHILVLGSHCMQTV